jgi:hypothetical protein
MTISEQFVSYIMTISEQFVSYIMTISEQFDGNIVARKTYLLISALF